jgi:hypothetical protein
MLLRELPKYNCDTLLELARFVKEVSSYQETNKMTEYNLAVIITPNLFRSKELTSKDLLNAGTLTEIFTLMMNKIDEISEQLNCQ